ncbi:substrate-binding domain-containing protein [Isoptericola sp. b441]|uniref:Substrate-binding domain-containing protein n=1 Tax=Actinotalea lenta TaxID=3064654 RepID=A0ABT9D6P3_9CELL|nr:substrate-binding domain-containing protein [Isoptericola sp. b441]MDO8106515.1 substrate-binding domain-containing protein [Isoptericola sp. b441]
MRSRKFGATLVSAVALLLVGACSGTTEAQGGDASGADSATSSGSDGKAVVAFSQEGLENDWRLENTASIRETLENAGYTVLYQQADEDQARQVEQVQNLLQQKPDILVVEPAEQEAATPIAALAEDAGVPLIVADRALGVGPDSATQYKVLITQNWEQMGTKLGEAAVQLLTKVNGSPKGSIVELVGVLGSAPQVAMDKGFADVLAQYPDIKILDAQDGENKRAPGRQIMEDYLTRYPAGQIDMVWAQNDEMGIGALAAIQDAGRDELVGRIISKDGQVEAIQQVAEGNFATVCTNTPYFGPIILPYVEKILAGESLETATPDKPFTCFESITDAGQKEAKAQYDELTAASAKFANR